MIFRFSLYGFLKNQRYFEPFLVLAFLEKGLSFFTIGLLIGFRELAINLMEVPSGALADLHGRRRCMVFSFLAYCASFVVFAYAEHLSALLGAMLLFAVGDAFRTGTHKAMIFDWLRLEGRESERTKVYGFTRSWSQIGSAVSVVLAALMVFYGGNYSDIFLFSLIPYAANMVNLATYPSTLDGVRKEDVSLRELARHLLETTRAAVRSSGLRRLMVESMGYDGVYGATKDYLQPLLKLLAISLPVLAGLSEDKRAALVVGAVYCVLYLLTSAGSRQSHRLVERAGEEDVAAQKLWWVSTGLFALLLPLLYMQANAFVAIVFVLMAVTHNVWRPILIARFDTYGSAHQGATLLSIESQAQSVATMILAPLLGLAVDAVNPGVEAGAERNFWPVAALGLAVSLLLALSAKRC